MENFLMKAALQLVSRLATTEFGSNGEVYGAQIHPKPFGGARI